MPVVTSATPAYVRTMRAAGQELHCASEAQWVEVLGRLIEDAGARASGRGRARVRGAGVQRRAPDGAWDQVLDSL